MNRPILPVRHSLALLLAALAGLPAIAQDVQCPGAPGVAELPAKPGQATLSKLHGLSLPAQLPVIALPALDNAELIARDDARGDEGILWVSEGRPVSFDFAQGQWFDTPDGGRLWVIDVLSPTAYGMRLHFKDFQLPPGASLVTYAPLSHDPLQPEYSNTGPLGSGEFWSASTFAQVTRVEMYLPKATPLPAAPFAIDALQHMYRDPNPPQVSPLLACHQDWTCWPGWATIGRSVARMYFVTNGNGGLCTGQLVNAFNTDFTPYFTSANHCLSTEAVANTLEAYWNYATPTCNGAPPDIGSVPRSVYAHMLTNSTTGDFSFMLLEGTVPRDAYWNGWSTYVPGAGEALTGISHPAGSFKRISFGNMRDVVTGCNGISTTTTTHIESAWWLGTTEPGSSGSGIYYPNTGQMLGVYSCQSTQCPNNAATNISNYGKFSYIYNASSGYFSGGSDDGYEPNDACASARYLGGVGYVYWGSALVVKLNSEDWYRVTVPFGGTLTSSITFTHSYGDIDMTLYDACGGNLVASSGSTSNAETITYTNNTGAARDYYIHVYLYNDTRNQYAFATNVTAPTPPASDSCGNALAMTEGQTITGSTQFATVDGTATCGTSSTTRDVWYTYLAPCTGTFTIDTYGSEFDTVLSARTSCPGGNGGEITCNDDANPPERWSQISFAVTRGTRYYIRVSGFNGANGNFTMHSSLTPPADDACATPTEIFEGLTSFNTCGCTTDGPPEPQCDLYNAPQIDNDFWCTYIPSGDGTLTVQTCGADFDSKIALYDATNGCPTEENSALICNDDSCGLQSSIDLHVTGGVQYYVRVGGYRNARGSGNLSLTLNLDPPPQCPADFNGDSVVDFFDYLDFVDAFSSNDPSADFNHDDVIDFFDYLDFVDAFSVGC